MWTPRLMQFNTEANDLALTGGKTTICVLTASSEQWGLGRQQERMKQIENQTNKKTHLAWKQ